MKINYSSFSEDLILREPIPGLEFADDLIKTYFIMSLRHSHFYYVEQPEGDTVYCFHFSKCSLLFYFGRTGKRYRIHGFRFDASERSKLWFKLMDMIEHLRRVSFDEKTPENTFSAFFQENVMDLDEARINVLTPFHFVVSSMPDACLPMHEGVRRFNRFAYKNADKDMYYIDRTDLERYSLKKSDREMYDRYADIFWVPPNKIQGRWYFEDNSDKIGIVHRKKRTQETDLPGKHMCCDYSEFEEAIGDFLMG